MSAIFEPVSSTWDVEPTQWGRVAVTANVEDRNVFLRRTYSAGTPGESIELHLNDLAAIEAALLNARLWLERAIKQREELKAAEEVGQDEVVDACEVPVCSCGHLAESHCTDEECPVGCHVGSCYCRRKLASFQPF